MEMRFAAPRDAGQILAIYVPVVESTVISFEETAPSVEQMTERIRRTLEGHPWLVCDGPGGILGYAYAGPFRERAAYQWSVEVSTYVHPDARRQGVARSLYTSLFEILRLQGFVNAFAGIALPNEASVRLHESLAFAPVGIYRDAGYKLKGWHDVGWWQLRLREPGGDPPPPRPLRQLRDTTEIAVASASVGVQTARTDSPSTPA